MPKFPESVVFRLASDSLISSISYTVTSALFEIFYLTVFAGRYNLVNSSGWQVILHHLHVQLISCRFVFSASVEVLTQVDNLELWQYSIGSANSGLGCSSEGCFFFFLRRSQSLMCGLNFRLQHLETSTPILIAITFSSAPILTTESPHRPNPFGHPWETSLLIVSESGKEANKLKM